SVTGWPPGAQVWMRPLGDEDPGEALLPGAGRGVVELQLVEAFEVEYQGTQRPVDLHSEAVLAAGGEPGGLIGGDGSATEPGDEQGRVVHRHPPEGGADRLAGQVGGAGR